MTIPAPPVLRPAPVARFVEPVAPPGHPGSYWDWERAAWVRWTAVPQPRRPRD